MTPVPPPHVKPEDHPVVPSIPEPERTPGVQPADYHVGVDPNALTAYGQLHGGAIGGGVGTTAQNDAFAILKGFLDQYGLSSLADWAWQQLLQNRSSSEIMLALTNRPEYQARFPVIKLRQEAGLPPVSPAEVIAYENSWNQIAVAAGLPPSFAGRDVAQKAMAGNNSIAEMQSRVQNGYLRVTEDPTVRRAFQSFFGTQGDSALAALFIDPDMAMPHLEKMVQESQIAAEGLHRGFTISEQTALGLAGQGVTQAQAQTGFATLGQVKPLFAETISETKDLTAEKEGVAAILGSDQAAANELKKRSDARQAAYAGSSDALLTQQGAVGLGGAPPR